MNLLSFKTCSRLIWRDLVVFLPSFWDRLINAVIWVLLTIVVFQYIFPTMGLSAEYGAFMACANAISWGFFEVMENVSRFVADLDGEKSITYDLTLPLPQWMVFCRLALASALQAMFISVFILPLSIVVLWNNFPLGGLSVAKVCLIFLVSNLFYGFFSLWMSSIVPNLRSINNIWSRVIFPLWWLGGYQFSWATMYEISPITAKCMLANPVLYTVEGMRAAVLGQEGYINFWVCFFVIFACTVVVGYIATKRMLKRLDCLP